MPGPLSIHRLQWAPELTVPSASKRISALRLGYRFSTSGMSAYHCVEVAGLSGSYCVPYSESTNGRWSRPLLTSHWYIGEMVCSKLDQAPLVQR